MSQRLNWLGKGVRNMTEHNQVNAVNMGVTPGVKTRMKILFFYVFDLTIVVIWWGLSQIISSMVFAGSPIPGIIFQVINIIFVIWLILPPYHNPGKRNYQMLIESILTKSYKYRSFGYYEFDDILDFKKIGGIYSEE